LGISDDADAAACDDADDAANSSKTKHPLQLLLVNIQKGKGKGKREGKALSSYLRLIFSPVSFLL